MKTFKNHCWEKVVNYSENSKRKVKVKIVNFYHRENNIYFKKADSKVILYVDSEVYKIRLIPI